MAGPNPSRTVSCPNCKGPSRYAPDNPFRPFCSQRCHEHDLGAWASEQFRVEVDPSGDDPDEPQAGDHMAH